MSAKIARGSQSRSKAKGKSLSRGSSKKAPPRKMMDSLPLPAETVRRVSGWIFLGVLLALGVAVAAALRVPQMVGTSVGEAVGQAGFAVKKVEIKGLNRMQRLLRFGWVEDARVYRRLPDTLVVDIVERQPAAIWQHNRQLTLIDREGIVLEPVKLEAMPDLPLVIGPGANRHSGALNALLAAAPELKPMMEGATWIGGRRWDLRFQSGEVLALPEGQELAQKALVKFARMDQATQLLGRGFARFDMRIPGKFIVRVSRTPGGTVPDIDVDIPGSAAPVDARKTI